MVWVDRLVALLGLDPFAYLVVTIIGVIVWVWCSVVTSFALTGRGLWIRRLALVASAGGAALFAYTAQSLK